MRATVRNKGIPKHIKKPMSFTDLETLKANPAYIGAKSGSLDDALALVDELLFEHVGEIEGSFPRGCIFISPDAHEASGHNQIPNALSAGLAAITEGSVDTEVIQSNKVFHTGASMVERLMSQPEFEGEIQEGRNYVIVDDVVTSGSTVAALSSYIQNNGGCVYHISVLTNEIRNGILSPSENNIKTIKERFGYELKHELGITADALTAGEASYLAGFRSIDGIRERIFKAEKERSSRLLSKGILSFESLGNNSAHLDAQNEGRCFNLNTSPLGMSESMGMTMTPL